MTVQNLDKTRRSRALLLAGCFAAFGFLAAACGSSDGTTADGTTTTAAPDAESSSGDTESEAATNEDLEAQRAALLEASDDAGPQAPRDIDSVDGTNAVTFEASPDFTDMNLCDIHIHEGAEHKGGEFTTYNGNGDGDGHGTGYLYDGELTEEELAPLDTEVGKSEHGDLIPGDTIEVHYVYSSAEEATLGNGLGTCLAGDSQIGEVLQVQARVYVLLNDESAADMVSLNEIGEVDGRNQAINIPTDLGEPVVYAGSTTGPDFNETPSPFQVTWSVTPNVLKVNLASVGEWFEDNVFDEEDAHGVRNLVDAPELLSAIG